MALGSEDIPHLQCNATSSLLCTQTFADAYFHIICITPFSDLIYFTLQLLPKFTTLSSALKSPANRTKGASSSFANGSMALVHSTGPNTDPAINPDRTVNWDEHANS